MKSYKSILGVILCVILGLCLVGCSNHKKDTDDTADGMSVSQSTDLTVIEKLFPSLEGCCGAETEQLKYGGSEGSDRLPGTVDYKYRGYVTLTDKAAQALSENCSFTEVQPQVTFESIEEREGKWQYSLELCEKIVPEGYVGTVWMDGNTLLFDIGTM